MNTRETNGNPSDTPANGQGSEADRKEQEQEQAQEHTEIGGPPGPEPTRYGDWEKNGRCIDF